MALSLIAIAEKKGEPEKVKAFWNTYHCQNRLITHEGRYFGKYCKNRFCTLCSSIRKAEIILLLRLNRNHIIERYLCGVGYHGSVVLRVYVCSLFGHVFIPFEMSRTNAISWYLLAPDSKYDLAFTRRSETHQTLYSFPVSLLISMSLSCSKLSFIIICLAWRRLVNGVSPNPVCPFCFCWLGGD